MEMNRVKINDDGSIELRGVAVPYLKVLRYDDRDDVVSILVDDRMAWDVPLAACEAVVEMAANAMAVAAGWSCFGPRRRRIDAFGGDPIPPADAYPVSVAM